MNTIILTADLLKIMKACILPLIFLKKVLFFLAIFLIISPSHATDLRGFPNEIRRSLFVELFHNAVSENPNIYLSQMNFVLDASGRKVTDTDIYSTLARGDRIDTILDVMDRYSPDVGIGLSKSASGINVSAGLTLNSLMGSLARNALNVYDAEEKQKILKELIESNPETVRGLGGLVYDSYKSTTELSKFHSLYAIAKNAGASLPMPDGSPRDYLDYASPIIRGIFISQLKAGSVSDKSSVLDSFTNFAELQKKLFSTQDSSESSTSDSDRDPLEEFGEAFSILGERRSIPLANVSGLEPLADFSLLSDDLTLTERPSSIRRGVRYSSI